MSALRSTFRATATIGGLVLVASGLSIATATTSQATAAPGTSVGAPRATSGQSAAAAAQRRADDARRDAAARTNGWAPSSNYVPYNGPRFGYLGRGKAEQARIRNQILATIRSVWGGPRDRYGLPLTTNGRIRLTTWSFGDKTIAKALVAARNRGVSVQIMGAADINKTHPEWGWLKKRLGTRYYNAKVPGSSERISFARQCKGSCRGRGGTPHSKFFLFDNVGANHARYITFQSSANLTRFAYTGQWNQGQVSNDPQVFKSFYTIFREMRPATYNVSPFRRYVTGTTENIFFPLPGSTASTDPVLRMLNNVTSCTGSGVYNGRTRIRVIQYAIYQSRGEAIARKLRQLWQRGCDVAIIYAVTTRPVLSILRSGSGRGPIPMKQSIIRGRDGTIARYNHSKWLTIAGNYGGRPGQWKAMSGSANWANLSLASDEQMQIVDGYPQARGYMNNFNITWAQRTSGKPTLAYISDKRIIPLPENDIPWGRGIYKNMSAGG